MFDGNWLSIMELQNQSAVSTVIGRLSITALWKKNVQLIGFVNCEIQVKKTCKIGRNACISNLCFLTIQIQSSILESHLFCPWQVLSLWTSLEFGCLLNG